MASSSKTETDIEQVKQEAFTNLAQGKRHFLVRDYDEAVASFGTACKLLAEQFGEHGLECADAYFHYGKALLELARTENGVLGDGGDEPEKQENDETAEEKEDSEDEGNEEADEAEGEPDGEAEDVSNLNLAWEMLELAKLIFERQGEKDNQTKLKIAEIYLKLGEVGMESENTEQAISDIKHCLEIQSQILNDDDRNIALTLYQLGLAYSLAEQYDTATEQFNKAISHLEKRIKRLEVIKDSNMECEESVKDPFYNIDNELEELKNLLPALQEKVSDMTDYKKQRENIKEALKETVSLNDAKPAEPSEIPTVMETELSDKKPVSNISHLVRKKMKTENNSDTPAE